MKGSCAQEILDGITSHRCPSDTLGQFLKKEERWRNSEIPIVRLEKLRMRIQKRCACAFRKVHLTAL